MDAGGFFEATCLPRFKLDTLLVKKSGVRSGPLFGCVRGCVGLRRVESIRGCRRGAVGVVDGFLRAELGDFSLLKIRGGGHKVPVSRLYRAA